jgi:hypothetical protein
MPISCRRYAHAATLIAGLLAAAPIAAIAQSAPATPAKVKETPAAKANAAETADQNLLAYAELLRADVRAQKVAILTELMAFTEAEDKAFWPIYREYDVALSAINDERVAAIGEYARNYPDVSDALADKLAHKALELEARRTGVKQKYYERFKTALSPKTAARFLQVENQLLMLIDLQIAAALPIVK